MESILNKKGKNLTTTEIIDKHKLALNLETVKYETSLKNIDIISEKEISLNKDSKKINLEIENSAYNDILNI